MSEAVQARAFEPFFTTKGAGRGTGLGLATVYGFAHQSQGAVALASRLGIGTTVTLYLPGPVQAQPESTVPAPAVPAGVAFPTGLSVLVVEDEPEVLRVVQAFLTGWGNRVTTCKNAEAALAEVGSDRVIDLLLTDVMLGPGLHGTELAQRAQARRPGLPVLLMSGYASYRGKAPLQPLLRKPFTREQLAEAMLRLLRRS
jgi:CheY-like chemotaxis protein